MSFDVYPPTVDTELAATAQGTAGSPVRIDPTGATTQPVSAAALPLPTGAATEATLAAIAGDVGDAADAEATGNGSIIAILKRLRTLLNGGLPALVSGRLPVDGSGVTQPVSGTVSVTEPVSVDDNGGSLTVDNPALSVVGGGAEAAALRVTLASDSTGLVSVDDNGGSLTVDGTVGVSGSVAVTNAGTFAVQDSEKVADNAGFTDGTTKVQPAGYIFDETAGTALTENDAAAARIDSKRAQVYVLEDESTRGRRATVTAGNALKVDGSAVTQPISAASLPLPTGAATETTLAALAGDLGDTADAEATGNGSVIAILKRLRTLLNGGLPAALVGGRLDVNVGNTATVSATDLDIRNLDVAQDDVRVGGMAAHDATIADNPVAIGFRSNADEPTAVSADGEAVWGWGDRLGRLVVIPGHPNPEAPVSLNATASGNTTVIAAPGASVSLYIKKASVHNRASTNRIVRLEDGAGGTIRWRAELAAEGGGSLIDFGERGWKLTANTLLNVNLDAAGDVDVNITEYYIAA